VISVNLLAQQCITGRNYRNASAQAAAPAGTYTVEGTVQDSSGKTLQQARIGTITAK